MIGSAVAIAFAVWWRIEGRVKEAKAEASLKADAAGAKADLVGVQLAEYKLHVSETFATKQSMTAGFEAVTKSINDVGNRVENRIDGMNERLDRVIEANHKPVRRAGN